MSGFIEVENLFQTTLFPDHLADYVQEDNQIRVIDFSIEKLNISGIGFKTELNDTGRPPYHPSMMQKIYVYGCLNRIQSSRRSEREARRTIELMWLTRRLAPDLNTISDIRKNNGEAILVC